MGIVSGFFVLTSRLLEVAVMVAMWQKLHKVLLRLDGVMNVDLLDSFTFTEVTVINVKKDLGETEFSYLYSENKLFDSMRSQIRTKRNG